MSGKTQFEGRTAEEAVARARKALGDSEPLRCWKTRKGGVGGFFAREVFVASLTPPPGSETRSPSRRTSDRRVARSVSDGSARSIDAPSPAPPVAGEQWEAGDHLSELVEATSDQLSLQSLDIPAGAFDQVLAEAQAALALLPEADTAKGPQQQSAPLERELEGETAKDEPGCSEPHAGPGAAHPPEMDSQAAPPTADDDTAGTATARAPTKPKTRPQPKGPAVRPAVVATPAPSTRQRGLTDLKPGLRSLGVPSSYLPPGRSPSLDQLADAMASLPLPSALPTRKGAVVAVVGADAHLSRTIDLVLSELALSPRDVLPFAQRRVAGHDGAEDLADAAVQRLDRQVARRRANGCRSLLAVQAVPGQPLERVTRQRLERAAPDYVLAAVGAGSKRADVEYWIGELPRVDALALWDLSGTRTPAELLGALPIAFIDGETGSPLSWTLYLAGRAVAWRR